LLEKEIQGIDGFGGVLTEDVILTHLLALLGVAVDIRGLSNLRGCIQYKLLVLEIKFAH
jgi:hypothetical protein